MTFSRLWIAPAVLLLAPALVGLSADKDQHGDPLPEGAIARLGTGRLRGYTYSPPQLTADGKTLLVTGPGGMFRMDPVTGARLGKVSADVGGYFVGLSADGTKGVHTLYDEIAVWDVATGKAVKLPRDTSAAGDVSVSADGTRLATGGAGNRDQKGVPRLRVWDVAARKPVAEIAAPHNGTVSVALSPDGKTLANWGYHSIPNAKPEDAENSPGRFVYFWDVGTGKELAKYRMPRTFDTPVVAFGPNGLAAVSNSSGLVALVDPKTGATRFELPARTGMARFLTFSPDGAVLAGCDSDGAVMRWRVADGTRLSTTPPPVGGLLTARVRLLDGERGVAWATNRQALVSWEVPSGKPIGPVGGHVEPVAGVAVGGDGKHVLTAASSGAGFLKWDSATGKPVGEAALKPAGGAGSLSYDARIVFSADGARALLRDDRSGVGVYDVATGTQWYAIPSAGGPDQREFFSADGSKVVVAGGPTQTGYGTDAKKVPARVGVWDAVSGKKLIGFDLPDAAAVTACVTPDGKHLVTGAVRKAGAAGELVVAVWELGGGAKKGEFVNPGGVTAGGVAAADDTTVVVTAAKELFAFDFQSGTKGRSFDTRGARPAFSPLPSPDGKRLAVACQTGSGEQATAPLFVFDRATGAVEWSRAQPGAAPRAMAFSPDGRRLVTGADDTTALVWDVSK